MIQAVTSQASVNRQMLRLYHGLPAPGRSLVATLRGFNLRRWRYGSETERLVEEARERENWDSATWMDWQQQRLAKLLERAATKVPFYRDYWKRHRASGDRWAWEDLSAWPVLEKESLRANPRAFLAEDCDPRKMFRECTSGTSGTPLRLWWSLQTVRQWYALFERRWRQWYDISRFDRWAHLGGQLVAPVGQRRPPFWVWNGGLCQLYMSSYHLSSKLIPYYLDALLAYGVKYLFGYASSLTALAQEAIRLGWRETTMKVVLTNAEPLYPYQRAVIGEAFGCPVRETYGMAEIATAAAECSAARLHLWPEAGVVEVLERNLAAPAGTPGDLVCTGLINTDMPLIRYRTGDRGCLGTSEAICDCGRHMPTLGSIDGRNDDVLYLSGGRRVGRLDPVFKGNLPVREAQIVQRELDQIVVRLVPAPDYTPDTERQVAACLQERLGPVNVAVECVERLARGAHGKLRSVICELSNEQRQACAATEAREPLGPCPRS